MGWRSPTRGINDRIEILGQQAGAADQHAIDVGLVQDRAPQTFSALPSRRCACVSPMQTDRRQTCPFIFQLPAIRVRIGARPLYVIAAISRSSWIVAEVVTLSAIA